MKLMFYYFIHEAKIFMTVKMSGLGFPFSLTMVQKEHKKQPMLLLTKEYLLSSKGCY